jgi:hypothetical protein
MICSGTTEIERWIRENVYPGTIDRGFTVYVICIIHVCTLEVLGKLKWLAASQEGCIHTYCNKCQDIFWTRDSCLLQKLQPVSQNSSCYLKMVGLVGFRIAWNTDCPDCEVFRSLPQSLLANVRIVDKLGREFLCISLFVMSEKFKTGIIVFLGCGAMESCM